MPKIYKSQAVNMKALITGRFAVTTHGLRLLYMYMAPSPSPHQRLYTHLVGNTSVTATPKSSEVLSTT